MPVLVLSHRDVLAALSPADCADAMTAVLVQNARGETCQPLRSFMAPPGAAGGLGLMPGWRRERAGQAAAFALKAVCVMPGNPARGLDAHQGVVTLFDGETGVPTALLDASAITEVRTAAVTAVATGLLARQDARTLAMIGAGTQARAHLLALAPVRAFKQIRVYAPTEPHAQALAQYARDLHQPDVVVAPSARDAVSDADVVVTVTSSHVPVLSRAWLKPGAHVSAVGASSSQDREIDTATVAASALFCDSRESLRNEAGEFQLAIDEGLIAGEEHVRAELGEVLAGTATGRTDDTELTLFRSLGLAIEDLAAAELAVATARERGLGTEVEW